MKSTLHILNGDAMLPLFEESQIVGTPLIWKESMFEGPIKPGFGDDFWQARRNYLENAYAEYGLVLRPHKEWTSYVENTLASAEWVEIVLWFEYDLFCQANMMAVLNWLPTQTEIKNISLVRLTDENGKGMLFPKASPKQMKAAFDERIPLDTTAMAFSKTFWEAYTGKQPDELFKLLDCVPAAFQDIREALHAHFYRFPSLYNGLDKVEEIMLRFIESEKPRSMEAVMAGLADFGDIYGLGDWQILRYVRKMSPQLLKFEGNDISSQPVNMQLNFKGEITLTPLAEDILWHRKNWLNFHDFSEWRGGTLLSKSGTMYFWDQLAFSFV